MGITYIGIDPGISGAVCYLEERSITFQDTPTIQNGKKRDYDIPKMVGLFTIFGFPMNAHAVIESVHAMPGQGVTSMFNFGKGLGIWLGILHALEISYTMVTPQRWKKEMLHGRPEGKEVSRIVARELFPQIADQLNRVKDHNRADALLMAEWARKDHGGFQC